MAAGSHQQGFRLSTVVKRSRAEWIAGELSSLHEGEAKTGSCKDSSDEIFTASRAVSKFVSCTDTCRGLRQLRQ